MLGMERGKKKGCFGICTNPLLEAGVSQLCAMGEIEVRRERVQKVPFLLLNC